MGWFGGAKQSKCPRCGAAVPFVISGGGGQDDLMRRSKVNVGNNGRNPLCSNCMRAAHVSVAHIPPPPPPPTPWTSPPPATRAPATITNDSEDTPAADDVDFNAALESARRLAATFGKEIDAEDIERLKSRHQQGGLDRQINAGLNKAVRGCVWTIFLTIAFFVVIGWLAN